MRFYRQNSKHVRKLATHELGRATPEQYKAAGKTNVVLVLDNVRSAHNVGSVFRTADAFLVKAVYLCGITAQPPHREIRKTALGTTEIVDWRYFQKVNDCLQHLKESGYEIIGIEHTDESRPISDFQPQKQDCLALVFGNEVSGISEEAIDLLDRSIEIPQFGTKHSLNVSVCVGVVVWDLFGKMETDLV